MISVHRFQVTLPPSLCIFLVRPQMSWSKGKLCHAPCQNSQHMESIGIIKSLFYATRFWDRLLCSIGNQNIISLYLFLEASHVSFLVPYTKLLLFNQLCRHKWCWSSHKYMWSSHSLMRALVDWQRWASYFTTASPNQAPRLPSQPLFHPSLLVDSSPPPSLCLPFWMADTFQSIEAPGPKPLINSRAIYVVHCLPFLKTPGAALGLLWKWLVWSHLSGYLSGSGSTLLV